jgi:iron complex outermembrane receptor protein
MGKYGFEPLQKSHFLRIIILSVLLLTIFSGVSAQTGIRLLDASLKPVVGASIQIEGSAAGTTTNQEGTANLDIGVATTIIISHVGFTTRQVLLRPGQWLEVVLEESLTGLGQVQVEGFLEKSPLNSQAGSISKIGPGDLMRYGEHSLVQAINSVPGIRFEERAGASYRVSIRGSSVRSPFGVRNVKVYWNGIPFTEPGGNTFLNLLDLANVSDIEIIKGPAASIYGAGNGGVIKLKSTNLSALANATSAQVQSGSFGGLRYAIGHNMLKEHSSLTFKWASQQSDGYRNHNQMDRKVFEFDGLFFPDERSTVSAAFLYSDLFYEIPGGLNPDQRAENRRMSRPNSIERNASVANEYFLLKLGYEHAFESGLEHKTNVALNFSSFENPFILDYKKDNQQVFSLRSEFTKPVSIGNLSGNFAFGTEYQTSLLDGKNFGNVNGAADTIRFVDEIGAELSTSFINMKVSLDKSWTLTAGLSYNTLRYDIDRQIDRINNNPLFLKKSFDNVWSPRVALSKILNDNYSLHFSLSSGFSPPTTTEVRTNEGSLNSGLQGERGTNYELNFRGRLSPLVSFDLAVFHFKLDEAITSFTDFQGVQLFRNAGGVSQNGVELQVQGNWIENNSGLLSSFSTGLSYTYHDFAYDAYVNDGDDFSGNALPGTAPHVLNLRADVVLSNGVYWNGTYHYSDAIPLNDGNSFFSRPYNLLNMRVGFKGQMSGRTNFEIYFGVDNLLDVDYSLGNDLNAFGRRYYQPAPSISYYAGLKLKFNH